VILNSPSEFVPNELQVKLVFADTVITRSNVAASAVNYHLQSSAFDPDPSFGTGAIPGFTDLSTFYQTYRVIGMRIMAKFANAELFPVIYSVWPSLENFTNNTLTASNLREYATNPYASSGVMGEVSGAGKSVPINRLVTTEMMTGSESSRYDPNWYALVGANPTSMWYWNIGFTGGASVFTGNGVTCDLKVEYIIEFTRRKAQLA
jgi:hypothetical protein